ncbi:hypothetical protein CFAEC_07940 [Corynebacterium faecale]|uniref:DUF3817 domain-containing protein n=1 Tax=Corynebacterium faecale TaxID=1758466 RepID=UPI0025B554F3|nr:DUF3817 domain-containing protein [Corynebacterium faecale]WJY92412.1 hypothetical protein CFAEC_07940 [Corynebacterium faecale]
MSPKILHRAAAWLEMFTWTFLIIGMILKYSGTTEAVVPIAGGVHGFGFLCFVAMTITVWVNNRWTFAQGIAGLVVSVIPWAALPFTLWADKKGLLDQGWRFTTPEEQPTNLADKILAQLVRHPVRSILIILVLIAIVFTILITVGQPYDPDALVDSVN